MTIIQANRWRSVIRIIAVVVALLGMALVVNEILENIFSCNAGACTRIHLSTMLWGLTLLSFGLLVLQKGDVSMSLRDLTSTGNAVATWFGRRAYDRKSGKIAAVEATAAESVGEPHPTTPPATDLPTRRDD